MKQKINKAIQKTH